MSRPEIRSNPQLERQTCSVDGCGRSAYYAVPRTLKAYCVDHKDRAAARAQQDYIIPARRRQ